MKPTSDQAGAEARLAAAGIVLPPPSPPVGRFAPSRRHGDLLYLSGQGPRTAAGALRTGKVGANVPWEEARQDARLVGMALLAAIRQALGSLDRVEQVVKLLGMVNAAPDFVAHPQVVDGCSELFIEIFGAQAGAHARSAVGMVSLPGNITVEIEAVVAVKP